MLSRTTALPCPACSWAVQQLRYHARAESIPLVFQAAAADLQAGCHTEQQRRQERQEAWDGGSAPCIDGSSSSLEITPEVVTAVWDRLLPGKRCTCTSLASLQGTRIAGLSQAAVAPQCVHVPWMLICSVHCPPTVRCRPAGALRCAAVAAAHCAPAAAGGEWGTGPALPDGGAR